MFPNNLTVFEKFLAFLKSIWYLIFSNYIGTKYIIKEFLNEHKSFDISGVPKRAGKIAVITGGSRGIGLEVVKKLLQCEMHVIVGCRDVNAARVAITKIRNSGILTGTNECLRLDLMSIASVKKFADCILMKNRPVQILINNAGIMGEPYRLSEDQIESHIQVNYLAPLCLTNLLLSNLIETGNTHLNGARVVNVSTCVMSGGQIDFDEFDSTKRKFYYGPKAYMDSKLMLTTFTNHLNRKIKMEGANLDVYSVHPGLIPTNLWKNVPSFVQFVVKQTRPLFRTESQGAEVILFAALSEDVKMDSGTYISNCQKSQVPSIADDIEIQEKLWHIATKIIKNISLT